MVLGCNGAASVANDRYYLVLEDFVLFWFKKDTNKNKGILKKFGRPCHNLKVPSLKSQLVTDRNECLFPCAMSAGNKIKLSSTVFGRK